MLKKIRVPKEFQPLQGHVVVLRRKVKKTDTDLVLPEGVEQAVEDAKAEENTLKEPIYLTVLTADKELDSIKSGDKVFLLPGAMSTRFKLDGNYVSMIPYHYFGAVLTGKKITEGEDDYIEVESDELFTPPNTQSIISTGKTSSIN